MDKIRWGILSTGNIAEQFAKGLSVLDDAELVAVGSRSPASAEQFGEKYNVPHRHATYEDLVNDPDVDAIYVATPHTLHAENSLLCLRAGKAVLCEKPFTINARQAEEVVGYARERGIFLMEAMWTRYLPHMVKLRELLAQGVIGEPRMLQASFGFRANFDPAGRLFNPELGGGALLDVGIYPTALASMVFGAPTAITGYAHLGETGVDEQSAMIYGYPQGQIATLSTAIRTSTVHEAIIYGTDGFIKVNSPWWHPNGTLSVAVNGKDPEDMTFDVVGNGYNYEAAEVARCLRAGKTESEIMPLDETVSLMRTLDQLRGQWGLRYPME